MSKAATLRQPEDVTDLVDQLQRSAEDTRCGGTDVVREAIRMVGFRYRISREQRPGLIDCSSLVAQSHWFGAATGTPFVAETQRVAYSARDVSNEPRRIADVLVRWPSIEESPGKRHNHVALVLGREPSGDLWLLQSTERAGVHAVRADEQGWARGGARRFLPDCTGPRNFAAWEAAITLARGVPKLGRLGARLTSGLVEPRRHRGIDVYLKRPVPLRSPLSGDLQFADTYGIGNGDFAVVEGEDAVVLLGPIARQQRPSAGPVTKRAMIGTLDQRPVSGCNSLPGLGFAMHMHFELWCRVLPFCGERGLSLPRRNELTAYNPLLAMREGFLASPLAGDTVVLDVRPAH